MILIGKKRKRLVSLICLLSQNAYKIKCGRKFVLSILIYYSLAKFFSVLLKDT